MARRSDHTREEIKDMALKAAAKLIEHGGIQGLTARKIASEIGYTVGTLYLVFGNLDDLILQTNVATLKEMAKKIRNAAQRTRKPEQKLKAMANAYREYATDHGNRWRLVFEHMRPADSTAPPDLVREREKMFASVVEPLRLLAPDQTQQELAHTTTALWSGVHGICILAITGNLYHGGAFSIVKLTDVLIDNFLRGLKMRPA